MHIGEESGEVVGACGQPSQDDMCAPGEEKGKKEGRASGGSIALSEI